MKITIAALLAAMMLTSSLYAEEELREAPMVILESIKANCQGYAEEDGVAAEELNSYLLKCINEELSDLEYRAITKL